MKVGLVEPPRLKLVDPDGNNITFLDTSPNLSKQVLMASLKSVGLDVQLFNLTKGNYEEEYGQVTWREFALKKICLGDKISDLDPKSCDVWGITNNFMHYREITCLIIQHLMQGGKAVVVGGSDAIAEPQSYFQAGATAVVKDKSGSSNKAIINYVLGQSQKENLTGVILYDGREYPIRRPALSPQDWAMPSLDIVKECLNYSNIPLHDMLLPCGSVLFDIGCDRNCDFCQTPTYNLGYKKMSPEKALEWCSLQKNAGANSIECMSDQFLGRVLRMGGRQEIFDIVNGMRELELPFQWQNGLELSKLTLGRGLKNSCVKDMVPDEELVEAIWGWDGRVGCLHAFIPAERPLLGRKAYAKLLPWQQHRNMLRAIVHSGIPNIVYGIIIGFANDNYDSLCYLEEAVRDLEQDLKMINPLLNFFIEVASVIPIPGTRQGIKLSQSGLLRFDDPTIIGCCRTACADTYSLTYGEVSDWQLRIENEDGRTLCKQLTERPTDQFLFERFERHDEHI